MLHGAFRVEGAGGAGGGRQKDGVAELKYVVVVGTVEVGEHGGVAFLYAFYAHVGVTHYLGRTELRV